MARVCQGAKRGNRDEAFCAWVARYLASFSEWKIHRLAARLLISTLKTRCSEFPKGLRFSMQVFTLDPVGPVVHRPEP
jgi:hypothetical protein